MIYFTSDTHFGHRHAIKFDNRPFSSVEEMDQVMMDKWNAKVQPEDTVYVLGDVSWHSEERSCELVNSLHGQKILVRGNHDRVHGRFKNCFEKIVQYEEIVLPQGRHVVLCHYPILFFNRRHYGSYMFYGHVHNSQEYALVEQQRAQIESLGHPCNAFNVGVMVQGYEPVTFDEIVASRATC